MNDTWDIECSGLSQADAAEVVSLLASSGFPATAVDPRVWLSWRLDADSVRTLSLALRQALDSTGSEHSRDSLLGLLEDCEEWLSR